MTDEIAPCGCQLVEASFWGLRVVVPHCWCHPPCPRDRPLAYERIMGEIASAPRRTKARRS